MRKLITSTFCTILLVTTYAQVMHQRLSTTTMKTQVVKQDTVPRITKNYYLHKNIPISTFKYLNNPASRYAVTTGNVYQPVNVIPGNQQIPEADRATVDDSVMLTSTINSLLETVRNNYTASIDAYIDTVHELDNVKKLQWVNSGVRKADIHGLNNNLTLLQTILTKDTFDRQDIEMVSYIFATDDSIIGNMHLMNYELMLSTSGIHLAMNIADTLNQPIPYASCYFLRKTTWRRIEDCDKCPVSVVGESCNNQILSQIDALNDGKMTYNSSTPQQDLVQLPYGPYHIVIAIDGAVYYHEIKNMDVTTPVSFTVNLAK